LNIMIRSLLFREPLSCFIESADFSILYLADVSLLPKEPDLWAGATDMEWYIPRQPDTS
jgi:hypothetical protein